MQIGMIGANFKTADLLLREQVAKAARRLEGERGLFFPYSTVVLSTCNRTEIYFSAEDLARAHADLLTLFRSHTEICFEQRLYSFFGADCAMHLCRVAAGLDSAIFLETEIQRQVKLAYAKAQAGRSLPPSLHYLFQKALHLAKRVRTQIAWERGVSPLISALWEIGGERWRGKVFLVGYSQIHRLLASFLMRRGISSFLFCTRFPEEVRKRGMAACSREEMERWRECDVVSSAAASQEGFLVKGKSQRQPLLFDLGVPRNIDPFVAEEGGLKLWNIEEIDRYVAQKRMQKPFLVEQGEALVRSGALRLVSLYQERGTGSAGSQAAGYAR